MCGSFLRAESDLNRTNGLIDRHRKFLEEGHPMWGANQARSLARQRESGALVLRLWSGNQAGAHGLVWNQAASSIPKVHGVWMEPAGPRLLSELLDDLALDQGAPVGAITDVIPGLPEENDFFRSRGYWHRSKVLMRHPTGSVSAAGAYRSQIRPIAIDDLTTIVGVYVRAYSDRPGEFWTWASADAYGMAEADVMGHVGPDGAWGPTFRPDASFVWVEAGAIVGAILVEERPQGTPYVEDLIVEPAHHRRGIGRALLERALTELTRDGPRPIELAAVQFGAPYRLYTRLGFVEVPHPEGLLDGHWIRGPSPF